MEKNELEELSTLMREILVEVREIRRTLDKKNYPNQILNENFSTDKRDIKKIQEIQGIFSKFPGEDAGGD